jgi:hypothetical protein
MKLRIGHQVMASTYNELRMVHLVGDPNLKEVQMNARRTVFAALVGVITALGPIAAVTTTATILTTSEAAARACGFRTTSPSPSEKVWNLYCNTQGHPATQRLSHSSLNVHPLPPRGRR